MTVIAFRPGRRTRSGRSPDAPVPLEGTFRSPRGRLGQMRGTLRVRRLVVVPGGTFVAGVFTGELRDADGSVIGVDTRRATIPAGLVRHGDGYLPVLQPFQLDLMGIAVDVHATTVDTRPAHPVRATTGRPRWSGGPSDPQRLA